MRIVLSETLRTLRHLVSVDIISSRSYKPTHSPPSRIACSACRRGPRNPQRYRLLSTTTRLSSEPPKAHRATERPIPQSKPNRPSTYYELFPQTLSAGPPPAGPFLIDVRALRAEFLRLQSIAHPDLAPPARKREAEAASSYINEAYKTLREPLARAQYLLRLRGITSHEDESSKLDENDQELLMEVLEAREEVEEAETEDVVWKLREVNEKRVEDCVRTLEELFAKDNLDEAKKETVKLRFWMNIRESLDNWEKGKPVVLQH
ncbi:Co-chaperone Hsc20 [Eremomyces bilateralis CBS 781.70]|uniref:Co-chaperone Hsc20 n=1 Tax=Eremomyces bilateralis CBS 781.70 TaxID=1392243 RepID=A0A6G1G694_9PEZI|nr:Co-chaperone Hsc20 [Eremomyces bilateralis CBS 781.70]KAF1813583.1 Co-chaperone Hsc20 [Eremomyces bilateralis CBS 781.70]